MDYQGQHNRRPHQVAPYWKAIFVVGSALVVLIALGMLAFAQAADISTKDSPYQRSTFVLPEEAPFSGLGVGVELGGQFVAIDIEDEFDGIAADGIAGGVHAEWLFGTASWRLGPYAQFGLSNVGVEISGDDVLTMDRYYGAGAKAGVVFNRTLLSIHAGYELQDWSVDLGGDETDIDTGWWNVGGGVEFMVSETHSIGLDVSYLMLNTAEIDDEDIGDALEESEALRVLFRATWRN